MPDERRQFRILYRDFLVRTIDPELLSAAGEPGKLLAQLTALLCAFSLVFSIAVVYRYAFSPASTGATISAVTAEVEFLIATTMAAVAILMLLAWNSVFLEKRDCYILGALPVRTRTIYLAKMAALGTALSATIAAINIFTGICFPLLVVPAGRGFFAAARAFAAYWLTMAAAGLFTGASFLAFQGLAVRLLPHRRYQRVSGLLQFAAFFAIAALYLLRPDSASVDPSGSIARWIPSFWFFGLFKVIGGFADAGFAQLAAKAWAGLIIAGWLAAVAFARMYRRSLSRVIEQPEIAPGTRTWLAEWIGAWLWPSILGGATDRAVVLFAGRTIARSRQHRLLLAVYGGAGFALALYYLRDVLRGAYTTEIWSFVGAPAVGVRWDQPSIPLLAAVLILLVFAITGLRAAFVLPIMLPANWVFRIASLDGAGRLFHSVRKTLYLFGAAPVWLLASILYLCLWPPAVAAMHCGFLALAGILLVESSLRGFPKIPFTCSYLPGKANLNVRLGVYACLFLIAADRGAALQMWAAGNVVRCAVVMGILTVVAALARYATTRAAAQTYYKIVFEDVPPPAVSPLSLSLSSAVEGPAFSREDEIDEELQFHLRMAARELEADGESPQQARHGALRDLGNLTRLREEVREVWRNTTFDSLLQDFRIALRGLLRSPGFSFAAVALIALGVGINGSVFSLFQSILHRPMLGVRAARMVSLGVAIDGREDDPGNSWLNLEDYVSGSRTLRRITARGFERFVLSTGQASYAVRGALAAPQYFETLGVRPVIGRSFTAAEASGDGSGLTAVISDHAWREQFDSAPDIAGRPIVLNGHPATVIGVAPPQFRGIQIAERHDVWVPLVAYSRIHGSERVLTDRGYRSIELVGELADGATIEEAQAEFDVISMRLEKEYPGENRAFRVLVRPYTAIGPGVQPFRIALKLLLVVAVLLMLVVSANVANLVLCRSVARQHELAIRKSLGAPLSRIFTLMFVEGLVLSLAAAGAGWCAAVAGTPAILHLLPGTIPELDLSPDRTLALYVLAVAVFSTVTFTVAPAVGVWRQHPLAALKTREAAAGRSRGPLMAALSLVQLVLSFVLLTGAGLLMRSSQAFEGVDLGFRKEGLLYVTVQTADAAATPEANARVLEELRTRLMSLPGIAGVSYAAYAPLSWVSMPLGNIHGDSSAPPVHADFNLVGPDYLATLGASLRLGREITATDRDSNTRVAVINERLAHALWPSRNPIGRTLWISGSGARLEVAGVVADGVYMDFRLRGQANVVFIPFQQQPLAPGEVVFHLRYPHLPDNAATTIRSLIHDAVPRAPVASIATSEERMQNMFPARVFSFLFSLFAGGALLLAAVGLYSIVALNMAQRTREFAVKIALGASGNRVLAEASRGGLLLIGAGLTIGLAVSLAGAHSLRSLLFGVSSVDPITFGWVILVLAGTCSAASLIPAWRATQTDPAIVLRED